MKSHENRLAQRADITRSQGRAAQTEEEGLGSRRVGMMRREWDRGRGAPAGDEGGACEAGGCR
eukprot:3729965-Pyramimonas_sp.AAC.1